MGLEVEREEEDSRGREGIEEEEEKPPRQRLHAVLCARLGDGRTQARAEVSTETSRA